MKARRFLFLAVLAVFAFAIFAPPANAVKCVSVFNKKYNARQAQMKKMRTLANKLSALLKKRIAAMGKVDTSDAMTSDERQEAIWRNPRVVKIQKQMNKNMLQQNQLGQLIAKTALEMDAAVKQCQKDKVDTAEWKPGWDLNKFTVKITAIGINETEQENAFNACYEGWVNKYRDPGYVTKGMMEAYQECDEIHTEWMKFEKMRYELLDEAFR